MLDESMAGRPHFLQPLLARTADRPVLRIRGHELALASEIETAFESADRNRGLLGRDGLPPDAALIIAPCSAVHTFGMRFAIDLIFADREGQVTKIRPAVPARRVAAAWGAFAVVEMAAGAVARSGLKKGDRLYFSSRGAK
jgi:uncharacterized membrane protein (UPF0127 family)